MRVPNGRGDDPYPPGRAIRSCPARDASSDGNPGATLRDNMPRDGLRRAAAILSVICLGASLGCSAQHAPPYSVTWVVGQMSPAFDPQGPPDLVRGAIERLVARGLFDQDSSGHAVQAAVESVGVSADGLVYTFVLRKDLTFTDGTRCVSADFRRAIEAGLSRLDHATTAWLLRAVVGVDRVRPGRPLPPLGIATPDDRRLVLRLSRPDPQLTLKLALPGIATPWAGEAAGEWRHGLGDYRVESASPARMVLVRRAGVDGPDTLQLRFAPRAAQARVALRAGICDLIWPVPPGLLDQPVPAGFRLQTRDAEPPRRLLLVMRADLAPTAKAAARHALAHGLSRSDIAVALGPRLRENAGWLPGAGPYDLPRRDAAEVSGWLERGRLGRSVHAVMAYARDGLGAEVARVMQTEWARLGLDVELRPLDRRDLSREGLRRGGAQLLLIEDQPLTDDLAGHLASVITPARGPAVGAWRSGWMDRDLEAAVAPGAGEAPDPEGIQQRVAEEDVVLPLGRLPWLWIERGGQPGVECWRRLGPQPRLVKAPATRS